jgi:TonB family protein
MFETSVVQAQVAAARGRFSLLTVSVAAHSLVILGAIGFSIASTDFPMHAPDEFAQAPIFMPVQIPPPLGDPNGGARREVPPAQQQQQQQQQQRQQTAPPQSNQITAPDPNAATQPATDTAVNSGSSDEGIPGATSTADLGVPWGTEGSTGTDLDAPPGPIVTNTMPEERIYEVHEVKAPVLLHKVAPDYPDMLRRNRIPATVIVRCVIDTNGRVRDPHVIVPALPPFNAEVIKAVQQWRYTPGSRNGIAVETYLNVTVTFSVK